MRAAHLLGSAGTRCWSKIPEGVSVQMPATDSWTELRQKPKTVTTTTVAVYISDRLLQFKLYRKPRAENVQLACHTQAVQQQTIAKRGSA
jgi:hypothetical protein